MITRNFKELLSLVLSSTSAAMGIRPVKDVTGLMWYAGPQFKFPGNVSAGGTLNANALGISIGRGTAPATENDYRLEDPITGGVTLTLTSTKVGCSPSGDPYVEYYVTVTNTGTDAVTVTEIGYKQGMRAAAKVGAAGYSDITVLMDRTVLAEPMTVAGGDAGVIVYKLKTVHEEKRVHGVKMVGFTYGTDEELGEMIDAARQGLIDLQTDGGWRVGDQRKIHINAWTGGNGVAHDAEELCIVISSFEEYEGCGNILQFDFMDSCTKTQRMNSSATTDGGYGNTEMYTTTLPALVEALPSWLKSRLKTFDVQASKGGSESTEAETIGNNKLALRSAMEVFGPDGNGKAPEGTQLEYYKNREARIKTAGYGGFYVTWMERSAYYARAVCTVTTGGVPGTSNADNSLYVAPFGCL